MSFTDQKQRIATEEECKANWGGEKNGKRFRCYLCGHKFVVGDKWRWVYNNNPGGFGNFCVCDKCDGEDVVERWAEANKEARQRFWWFGSR